MTRQRKGKARTHHWHFLLSPQEQEVVYNGYKRSAQRSKAAYVRDVLLKRPIITQYRNQSFDEYLALATGLKSDLEDIREQFDDALRLLRPDQTPADPVPAVDVLTAAETALRQNMRELMEIMIKIEEQCTEFSRRH
jgi:hypothetical protein